MERSSVRAARLFYAVAFFESLYFYSPVATLYRMEFGVTIFQITLIDSVFCITIVLLEIPWGFITARIGYKNTMITAGALNLLAALIFWQADGFGMFLVQRVFFAAAVSGFSGCDIAYLSRITEPDVRHKVLGRYNAVTIIALASVGVSFSAVSPFGYRTLAMLTMLCMGIGFILRLLLPGVESEPQDMLPPRLQIKALWQVLRHNRLFLLFVISGAVLAEVENTFTVFFSAPAYLEAGIAQNRYGFLNLSLNLVGLAGGLLSARLARMGNGIAIAICWMLALVSAAALCLTQNALALILLLPILRLAVQMYLPCEQLLKTERTGSASRAVVLSAYSMVTSIAGIFLGPILGVGTEMKLQYGFYTGFGLLVLASVIVLIVWKSVGRQADNTNRINLGNMRNLKER